MRLATRESGACRPRARRCSSQARAAARSCARARVRVVAGARVDVVARAGEVEAGARDGGPERGVVGLARAFAARLLLLRDEALGAVVAAAPPCGDRVDQAARQRAAAADPEQHETAAHEEGERDVHDLDRRGGGRSL